MQESTTINVFFNRSNKKHAKLLEWIERIENKKEKKIKKFRWSVECYCHWSGDGILSFHNVPIYEMEEADVIPFELSESDFQSPKIFHRIYSRLCAPDAIKEPPLANIVAIDREYDIPKGLVKARIEIFIDLPDDELDREIEKESRKDWEKCMSREQEWRDNEEASYYALGGTNYSDESDVDSLLDGLGY